MKALKLSSNVDEKKQLKARCGALIDTADRIKNSENWILLVDPNTKEGQLVDEQQILTQGTVQTLRIRKLALHGQARLRIRARSSTRPNPDHQTSYRHQVNHRFLHSHFLCEHSNYMPKEPAQVCTEMTPVIRQCLSSISRRINLKHCTKAAGKHLLIRNTKAVNKPITTIYWTLGLRKRQLKVHLRRCRSLATSDRSQQLMALLRWHWREQRGKKPRSLRLPRTFAGSLSRSPQESDRERKISSCSRHQSSMVSSVHLGTRFQQQLNSFRRTVKRFSSTCAPMITRHCLTKDLRDTRDLSLSSYQQQFFQGWVRAHDAMPPPALHPKGRDGIGPLMSSSRSIDLVQDAASDCSVVASLCAGVARAERGHDQVRGFSSVAKLVLTNDHCRCSKTSFTRSIRIWEGPSHRPMASTSFVSTSTVAGARS